MAVILLYPAQHQKSFRQWVSAAAAVFEMDTVILTLDAPLAAGNYQVVAQFGGDSTSVTDNYDRNIPKGNAVNFPYS